MKKLILFIGMLTFAFCVPAFQGPMEFKQNDGSTFQGKLKGDEWFNWVEDQEGNIIKYNKESNNYEYGTIQEKNGTLDLIPSGIKVGNKPAKTESPDGNISDPLKIDKVLLKKIWRQKREKAYEYKAK
ncbi:MAG: hypothetical protein LT067_06275 [Sulfurovum sp.]|nr:hypothetical protein [Sulfurovum sp.]